MVREFRFMSELLLLFVIFVEGFVTISAEILTMRQLIPMVGNSIVVTSLIIGVFLLFLAYGYQRGGKVASDDIRALKANFAKSAIWLGVGLSYVVIELFFHYFKRYVSHNSLWVLTAYLLIVTAPLVYLLGQTVPMVMNLIRSEHKAGTIGGKILHFSTIGSFFGSVLTSLFLMNYLGVGWTVFINYALLTGLVLLLFTNLKADFFQASFLIFFIFIVYHLNVSMENKLFVKTNAQANYKVSHDDEDIYLEANGSHSSYLSKNKEGFHYIEAIKKILFRDLELKDKSILVLGAGGFTLSAEGSYGNNFLYVDFDKDIKAVVEKDFLKTIQGSFQSSDARAFLNSTDRVFDVIVSDVYGSKSAVPAHLLTVEYFNQMKKKLVPEGIAVINIIARPTLSDPYSYRVDNTIRTAFNRCMSVPMSYTEGLGNIIYVCHNDKDDKSHAPLEIYSDNLNQATLDFFKSQLDKTQGK